MRNLSTLPPKPLFRSLASRSYRGGGQFLQSHMLTGGIRAREA